MRGEYAPGPMASTEMPAASARPRAHRLAGAADALGPYLASRASIPGRDAGSIDSANGTPAAAALSNSSLGSDPDAACVATSFRHAASLRSSESFEPGFGSRIGSFPRQAE